MWSLEYDSLYVGSHSGASRPPILSFYHLNGHTKTVMIISMVQSSDLVTILEKMNSSPTCFIQSSGRMLVLALPTL